MSDDLRVLRELAEAATPGPWTTGLGVVIWTAEAYEHGFVVIAEQTERNDGQFIAAANPTTVLALLDRLEAAEAAVERVRALADELRRLSRDFHFAKRDAYEDAERLVRTALGAD